MHMLFPRKPNTSCQKDRAYGPRLYTPVWAVVATLIAVLLHATAGKASVWYPGEFSATIALSHPTAPQSTVRGTFHVGQDRFRAEGDYQGQRTVLIVQARDRKVWTLFPQNKTYYAGPGRTPTPPKPDIERLPGDRDGPCQQQREGVTCRQVGTETRHGIATEKWVITYSGGSPAASNAPAAPEREVTLWVDPTRRIVIRQQFQDGPSMERSLTATEPVHGRQTEKWTFVQSFQGKTREHVLWVDAALRVPVREETGGKVVMELVNIQEKPQPANLFEVPASFREIQPPFPPSGEQPSDGGRLGRQGPEGPGGGAAPSGLRYH